MHGIGLEYNLQDWFDFKIPKTKIPKNYIYSALVKQDFVTTKPTAKIVWMGSKPFTELITKSKKGNTWQMLEMTFHSKKKSTTTQFNYLQGEWMLDILEKIDVKNSNIYTFSSLKADFENKFEDFELFWYSKPINMLRQNGLLVL